MYPTLPYSAVLTTVQHNEKKRKRRMQLESTHAAELQALEAETVDAMRCRQKEMYNAPDPALRLYQTEIEQERAARAARSAARRCRHAQGCRGGRASGRARGCGPRDGGGSQGSGGGRRRCGTGGGPRGLSAFSGI